MKKSWVSTIVTVIVLLAFATVIDIYQRNITIVLMSLGFVIGLGIIGMQIIGKYEKEEKRSQAQ